MRKFLISLAVAASAIGLASPASAQFYGHSSYGYNRYDDNGYGYDRVGGAYQSQRLVALNRQRMERLEYQIRSLEMQGRLSPGEAASLERTAAQFRRELEFIARDGMTGQEGAVFDARVDQLGRQIRRYSGYGYDNGYGPGYGYGQGYGYNAYNQGYSGW